MNTGTAVGTAGAGAMLATVIVYIFSLRGITIPDQVSASLAGLLTMGIHIVSSLVQNWMAIKAEKNRSVMTATGAQTAAAPPAPIAPAA